MEAKQLLPALEYAEELLKMSAGDALTAEARGIIAGLVKTIKESAPCGSNN